MDLAGLWQRHRVVRREAMKFGLVGAFNTVLDFAVLNVLLFGFGVPALRSKVASTVVAATSSYVMNRCWTFNQRQRQRVRREYVLFFGINAVGLLIGLLVLAVVRYGLDRDGVLWLNMANLVGLGLATSFRFWGYRRFVWTAGVIGLGPAQEQASSAAPEAAWRPGSDAREGEAPVDV